MRRHHLSAVVSILLVCLGVAGCRFEFERGLSPGEVRGRVVFVPTGDGAEVKPAAGAQVRVIGATLATRTDANGRFVLRKMPGGELRVRIDFADDDRPLARILPVRLAENASGPLDAVDLGVVQLNVVPEVKGTVRRGGSGIAGAQVVAQGIAATVTRSDGTYSMRLPEGAYELAVVFPSSPSARAQERAPVEVKGPTTIDFDVNDEADPLRGSLTGTLRIAGGGSSAEGVLVQLFAADGNVAMHAEAGADGGWVLGPVDVGVYRLTASGSGLRTGSLAPVAVTGESVAPVLVLSLDDGDCDGDGIPDSESPDDDADGVPDSEDQCVCDPSGSVDSNGDGVCDSADIPTPDLVAPVVTATVPAADEVDVPLGVDLSITFDEPIDPSSLVTATVTIDPDVGASLRATDDPHVVEILTGILQRGVEHTVTVAGVRDAAGNPSEPYTWSFTMDAGDVTPPTIVSTMPADGAVGVSVSLSEIRVEYSEPIDAGPLSVVIEPSVAFTRSVDPTSGVVTIALQGRLVPDTGYAVTLSNAIDLVGNVGAPESFGFTTESDVDPPAPMVFLPARNSIGNPESVDEARVTFDEAILPDSLAGATITVTEDGDPLTGVSTDLVLSTTLRVQFAAERGRAYEVSVSGLTDAVGNVIAPFSWTFRTRGTSVALGRAHGAAIRSDGSLWRWGATDYDAAGLPTRSLDSPSMHGGSDWDRVVAGGRHACALRLDGSLWCWGENASGQLGIGTNDEHRDPVQVTGTWRMVAAGEAHTCAIDLGGDLYCWGENGRGQLGDDVVPSSPSPRLVPVEASEAWHSVVAGAAHTCALRAGGELLCWGANDRGQLGRGTTTDGGPEVVGTSAWSAIFAGARHTCAIDEGNTPQCWGDNAFVQLGRAVVGFSSMPGPIEGLTDEFVQLAGGDRHTCARSTSGFVYCWGANESGQLGLADTFDRPTPQFMTPVDGHEAVVAGGDSTCIVRALGDEVFCFGSNTAGAAGVGEESQRREPTAIAGNASYVRISAGRDHACAVTTTSTVHCWGGNAHGEVSDSVLVRRAHEPVVMSSATIWTDVVAGYGGTCLVSGATVSCTGDNRAGQLGGSVRVDRMVLTVLDGATGWAAIGLGETHGCGVTTGGRLKCWGTDTHGQTSFGEGTHPPTFVDTATDWADVVVGRRHTMALKTDGSLWGFGDDTDGQVLGTGGPLQTPTRIGASETYLSVAVGEAHTCAVEQVTGDPPRSLRCWGSHAQGQLGIGSIPSEPGTRYVVDATADASEVWAGAAGTCARLDGEVYCFGANAQGELGIWMDGPLTTPTPATTSAWLDGSIAPIGPRPHACWIDDANVAYCAGANDGGKLGTGSSAVLAPTLVFFGSTI